MYSKIRKNTGERHPPRNFFVGSHKGEVGKIRAIFSKVLKHSPGNQVDTYIVRAVCGPIPSDQEARVAAARGENPSSYMKNQILYVKII